MKLKEFEGKQLLKEEGLNIPNSFLLENSLYIPEIESSFFFKVQTFKGGRKKLGGVFEVNKVEIKEKLDLFLNSEFNSEIVTEVLLEEKQNVLEEYYVSFLFDTRERKLLLIVSLEGGVDIENIKLNSPEKIIVQEVSLIDGLSEVLIFELSSRLGIQVDAISKFSKLILNLFDVFVKYNLRLLEVNPVGLTNEGEFVILDCVMIVDDSALSKMSLPFEPRQGGRKKTLRELRANKIDEEDHRGVSGKTFIDLDGDIGLLSSGGGASVIAFDSIYNFGGKLANYTEYSGNPPKEKVQELTRVVLDRDNLSGLFIVGGRANFTRIDVTLKAILEILIESNVKFPILVRRAGPGYEVAFEEFRLAKEKFGLDIHLYDDSISISEASKLMVDLSNNYKKNGNNN